MKQFNLLLMIIIIFSGCNCSKDKKELEVKPCGICADRSMVCNGAACECPEGFYKFGRFCEKIKPEEAQADFTNTPFKCKESGVVFMPSFNQTTVKDCDFGIFFSDGSIGQTSSATYNNYPNYEIVRDEFFQISYNYSGICDSNRIHTAYIRAIRQKGSEEVSVFFKAFEKNINDVVDTFTIVFRK